jgi:hypothetical protein
MSGRKASMEHRGHRCPRFERGDFGGPAERPGSKEPSNQARARRMAGPGRAPWRGARPLRARPGAVRPPHPAFVVEGRDCDVGEGGKLALMATLKSSQGEFRAPCRCLIGRSALADLRLESRRGSSEHASLGWYSGRWVLRDLGSSNGTKLNSKSLFPGDRTQVTRGSRLQFGDDGEVWTVVDCEEPEPCAVLLGPQQTVWGAQTLLVLPASDAPEASVFADADVWRLDTGAEVRPIECGDVVMLPSGYWRVLVPEHAGSPHARTAGPELAIAEIALSFSVTAEKVSVTVQQGATTVSIPSRACLNTLVALCRLRLRSDASEPERGWVSAFDLADMLHSSPEKVNVDVHRLRKLFQDAGLRNAQRIVERDGAKKLRVGVARLVEVRG